MRRRAALLAGLAALAALPAGAQQIVTSAGPGRVAVTLYRAPDRQPDDDFDLRWLDGFAMVTETRTIELPAGEAEIRFEGVAGGILPQSAIVAGFPEGVVERNRDAYLLSPATLLDRSLGQRVAIRRTSFATGAVTETEAVIRSGANGAVVLETREGSEALRCTGQQEAIVYDSLPAGLAARPTLSVRTRTTRPVAATVTLAYLASGFDWQAYYIAQLSPEGTHVDLLAWLTLASNDETSFEAADTRAVAGRVNREAVRVEPREGGPLTLQCWPAATTSDIPLEEFRRMALADGRALPGGQEVVVTGSRMMRSGVMASPISVVTVAERETLGDLQLYRIPEPVTLAARSQKQVAFLVRTRVPVRFVNRQQFSPFDAIPGRGGAPVRLMLTRNRPAEQLGEPLPAGRIALLADGPDRPILLGEGTVGDHAVGEDVEVNFGPPGGVTSQLRLIGRTNGTGRFALTITNDSPRPVAFEADLRFQDLRAGRRLERRNGRPLWRVSVPANGRVSLCFSAALTADFDRGTASRPEAPCVPS